MENNYKCNASKLLEEYEGLYINDPIGALKKMIDLFPVACSEYDHETSDAIEIWLSRHMSSEIKIYIHEILSKEKNPDFVRIYNYWLNW